MKRMRIPQRILSLALALVLVVGLLPVTVFAAELSFNSYTVTLTAFSLNNDPTNDPEVSAVYLRKAEAQTDGSVNVTITVVSEEIGYRFFITLPRTACDVEAEWDFTNIIEMQTGGSTASFHAVHNAKSHTGGSATCIAQAVCSVCGNPYGDYGSHNWGDWTTNNGRHIRTCKLDTSHQESGDCTYSNATCLAAAACSVCGHEYAAKQDHSYTYTANGGTLTEECPNGCGHNEWAKLEYATGNGTYTYTGSEIKPLKVTTSSGWKGGTLDISYSANTTNVGAAKGVITKGQITAELGYTITEADIANAAATLEPTGGTYTGETHTNPTYTLTYNGKTLDDDDYTAGQWSGNFLDAGDNTLVLTGKGNFTGTKTITYTIKKATPPEIIFPEAKNAITYGQKLKDVALTFYENEYGIFQWSNADEVINSAGSHYGAVEFHPFEQVMNNYDWASNESMWAESIGGYIFWREYTVNKANSTCTDPVAKTGLAYTGSPQELITAGTATGGTMLYKLGENGTYSKTIPTAKNAGTYTVYYYVKGDSNHNDSTPASVTATIAKAEVTAPVIGSKAYTGTAQTAVVPESKLYTVNTNKGGTAVGSYEVVLTLADPANYKWADSGEAAKTLTFQITQAPLTVTAENKEITYGDAVPTYTVTYNGFVGSENKDDLGGTLAFACDYKQFSDATTYGITPSGLTSGNYDITFVPGTLTVSPKKITVTIDNKTSEYGKEIVELTATDDGIVNNDENVYSLATTATSTADVDTYAITGTALDGNYDITFKNGTYTITKANAAFTAPTANTLTYNGEDQTLIVKGSTDDGTMVYSLEKEGTYTADLPKAMTAGTYHVWYKVIGDGNHKDSDPASVEVEIDKADPAIGTVTAGVVNDTLETSAIVPTRENTTVEGMLTVDAGQTLSLGENTIRYTFTPKDTTNYKVVTGEVTVTVKDTIAPTGTVTVSTNSWNQFLNDITFGLFFKQTQTVSVSATDNLSGVAKIEYIESKTAMDLDAVKAAQQWTEMKNGSVSVTLEDTKQFIYYIRITDKSGNVAYLSTDGAEYDTTAPVIEGVNNGATYYTTQTVTVTDKNIDTITLNGEAATGSITLEGNKEATYTIVATDKAGNSTTVTVTMKPIRDLAEATNDLTNDNVTSANTPALEALIEKLDELLADDDVTDGERETLEQHKAIAESLIRTIEAVAADLTTEEIEKAADKDASNAGLEDKEDLQAAKDALEAALEENSGNYTLEEKADIQKELDRLADAIEAVEQTEAVIEAVDKFPDSVKPDLAETDEKAIRDAKSAYDALTDHQKSLMEKEDKDKLLRLFASLTDYDIIKGDGGKWTKESGKTLEFTANGPDRKFLELRIDGKAVASSGYIHKDGSTVITLRASYLETLKIGRHSIQVVYTDGKTDVATFRVYSTGSNPLTGDDMNLMLLSGAAMTSLLCMAVMILFFPRKKGKYQR